MAVVKRKFKVNRFKVKDTAASSRRAAPGSKMKAKSQPEVGKYVKIRPPVHSEKSPSPRVNPTKSKKAKADEHDSAHRAIELRGSRHKLVKIGTSECRCCYRL